MKSLVFNELQSVSFFKSLKYFLCHFSAHQTFFHLSRFLIPNRNHTHTHEPPEYTFFPIFIFIRLISSGPKNMAFSYSITSVGMPFITNLPIDHCGFSSEWISIRKNPNVIHTLENHTQIHSKLDMP